MIEIEITTNKAEKRLQGIINRLDFNQPLKQATLLVKQEAKQNIDTQGFTYGKPFAPLKASTRRDRQRHGFSPSRPILVRTGRLRGGFVSKEDNNTGVVTNDVSYAKYHQFGTRKMVKRTILDTTDKQRKAIALIFKNYLRMILR